MELQPQSQPDALQAILIEMRKQRVADELWTAHEIADYLKLSVKSIGNRVLNHDTFPCAVILPTRSRRWLAKEVRAWAIKHREPA
jgi:predicted DNA-binding transcriptional regulator AlpA